MGKEKDTTVWKPKGDQKITKPSGPASRGRDRKRPRSRRAEYGASMGNAHSAFSEAPLSAEAQDAAVSHGYDAPSSGLGKLGLLIGAGAIIAALARGVKNSDYYKD